MSMTQTANASAADIPARQGGRTVSSLPNEGPEYGRRFGLLRDSGPTAEIASLDPLRDYERIVYLLTAYEFPRDIAQALELALFHTYGSASVAGLLDRTGQFRMRGQKRYDDTQLLMAHFLSNGLKASLGKRAIQRMNEIHGQFRIPNEDFLFVLWTFVDFPIQWTQRYAWRPFTEQECLAWFTFWREVGLGMGIQDIPETREGLDAFVREYEARELVPSDVAKRVAEDTLNIIRGWLPKPLHGAVLPVVNTLIADRLRHAFGYPAPSETLRTAVEAALKAHGRINRSVPLSHYPARLREGVKSRTYGPRFPDPEQIGFDRP